MNPQDFSVTRAQARELDSLAIHRYGIPGLILMENAGRACAREAAAMLGRPAGQRLALFCGPGNNGGDGFVAARHLDNWGYRVHSFLSGRIARVVEEGGDAAVNLRIALNMGVPVAEIAGPQEVEDALHQGAAAGLIVDALLGTGLASEVREPFRSLIDGLNALGRPTLAVDVPSGLDCDTGQPLGTAIRASRTVTFVLSKRGFARSGAAQYTGEVRVADIGVPRRLIEEMLARWQAQEQGGGR